MKKFYSLFAFVASILFCVPLFAVGTETTSTGLDITYISNGVYVERFRNYSLGTSNAYIYNKYGSSTPSTAGSFNVIEYRKKGLRIDITGLLDAGTTTLGIFHADGTTTTWSTCTEIVYSGTQSASFPISEDPQFQRMGIKRSGTSTATVTLTEIYLK